MTAVLHHRCDGPTGAPPLLLGPSLGTSLAVWDAQAPALAERHRVVRWDLPGHGGTPAGLLRALGTDLAVTVADLAGLVITLADSLGIDRFAYAGVSLGGAVGAWLAVHHPERVTTLALVCSSARFGGPEGWQERAALVRGQGTEALTSGAPGRWFTPAFAHTPAATAMVGDLLATSAAGYADCCDALAGFDLRADLARITAPTLVVAGQQDPATPLDHATELADGIPGAVLVEIPAASHLAPVEQPGPVLAALTGHLAAHPTHCQEGH
ncbi:3-oxoadipate enol-lactonase [Streptomyces sp. NPDC051322]|uniref:3-oxoadipate enol-lactonase n=1 Tax=Streptomyces sp. NPDC051322 TaxID=3154645 RepID=UPI00344B9A41